MSKLSPTMTFSKSFFFALTGLCFFLATSVTVDGALVKRETPDFIENWPLYRRWQAMFDSIPDFEVPDVDGAEQGDFEKKTGTLKWACYTLVLGDKIVSLTSTIEKASLEPYDQQVVVSKRSSDAKAQVLYGAKLQKSIDNENVLPVIDYVCSKAVPTDRVREYGWSIMPYVAAGSLENNYDAYPDQKSINSAFKQVLNAVAAVSAAGIIHRDLKPENFLKDGDTLKLMDFDQSRETTTSMQIDVGTPSYTAPGM